MQGRSWMAALTVAVGIALSLTPAAVADDKPAPAPPPAPHTVKMMLDIAGLGNSGCDIEIKPGNGSCHFRPITRHINKFGRGELELRDVRTTSADRACAFAITIREPGHAVRTVRRGLVLPSPQAARVATLNCYLRSPSKVAQAEQKMRQSR